MTLEIQSVEWEYQDGTRMTKGEFIMHHSCKERWEDLGVYPVEQHYNREGLYMKNVEFTPGRVVSFKVSVNDDSTLNFEIFGNPHSEENILYGAYLKHVDEINDELVKIREVMVND